MVCYSPAEVWPACPPAKGVVWARNQSYPGAVSFRVPCGGCVGCRLDKARDWATRMQHEASLQPENSFVTLTYSDQHLPLDGSISVRAAQLFFKRLRKRVAPTRVRYFVAGEYGDGTGRPHYHAILFGWDFSSDRVPWRTTGRGDAIFRSPLLEEVWPYGNSEVGAVTHQSAGYVARYCLKKLTGQRRAEFTRPHPVSGVVYPVVPPFATMSRRPGIGSGWYDAFPMDCFPSDFLVVDGQKVPVPRFYKTRLQDERLALRLLQDRKAAARLRAPDNTPERLEVREESRVRKLNNLPRTLEQDQ